MTLPDPDDRLTPEQAATITGKAVKSVRRWMREGVTVGGRRVRLASVKVGASRLTARSWLAAFVAAQNPGGTGGVPVQTPAERSRAAARRKAELARVLRG